MKAVSFIVLDSPAFDAARSDRFPHEKHNNTAYGQLRNLCCYVIIETGAEDQNPLLLSVSPALSEKYVALYSRKALHIASFPARARPMPDVTAFGSETGQGAPGKAVFAVAPNMARRGRFGEISQKAVCRTLHGNV